MKFKIKVLKKLIKFSIKKLSPKEALKFLFDLENYLYFLEGELSVKYGKGLHTKHRHTKYHQFFIKHIKPGDKVLDIGCGNGFVDCQIIKNVPRARILGIDLNKENVDFANNNFKHSRLKFVYGDVFKKIPVGRFDIVILSNVLEHFKNRVSFLKKIVRIVNPKRILLRVPTFERDWRVPLKKELGIDYRLDRTHFIEYTQETFKEELEKAGLKIATMEIRWGEIWAVVA